MYACGYVWMPIHMCLLVSIPGVWILNLLMYSTPLFFIFIVTFQNLYFHVFEIKKLSYFL